MAYTDEVLADNPLGYWRLGATATTDATGHGYTLTATGTPTAVTGLPPTETADGARDIDTPDTDFYTLASGAGAADDFDYEGTASFSVECWVNLRTPGAGEFERIVAHEDGTNGWLLYYHDTAGIGIGRQRAGSFSLKDEVPSGGTLGSIYHVVGTYDGANLRLYLNGTEAGSSLTDTTSIGAFTATLRIGRSPLGGTTGMNGVVDEVAVYSSALAADRVATHYTAGTSAGGGGASSAANMMMLGVG